MIDMFSQSLKSENFVNLYIFSSNWNLQNLALFGAGEQ